MLLGLSGIISAATLLAALLPPNPWVMVGILIITFSAMGAGNGAVFQLVPLRFGNSTAAASSLIGEIGALFGAVLPNAMGVGKQVSGSYTPGFVCLLALSLCVIASVVAANKRWSRSWVGEGGKALERAA
jgi:NNP family nitrate/nitrite transporter-like MFS transporter